MVSDRKAGFSVGLTVSVQARSLKKESLQTPLQYCIAGMMLLQTP